MKMKKLLILGFYIMNVLIIYGQENDRWIAGIGINIVDNSGTRFDELLYVADNWNISRLLKGTIEKRFKYDWGIELSFSMNQFSKGKKINLIENENNRDYYAIDTMLKNYTSNYWQDARHAWYTAYIVVGWGGNFFNGGLNNTINVGAGINIKMKHGFWINFQTLGKFSIDNNTPGNANHLQHSISTIIWL